MIDDSQITDEIRADLAALKQDHGLNDELIQSLFANPTEATEALRFFRGISFVTNIVIMTISLAGIGFGGAAIVKGEAGWGDWVIAVFGGLGLMTGVRLFILNIAGLRATEYFAKKHGLI